MWADKHIVKYAGEGQYIKVKVNIMCPLHEKHMP